MEHATMESALIDWSDFCIPVTLPELVVTPTPMQVFMFSAVTWNRHHIHYSRDAAVREGLPDIVVQRALIGNYLSRLLANWMGQTSELVELSWKMLSSAVPDHLLRCNGAIVDSEPAGPARLLRCELRIADETGKTIAEGNATIRQRST